MIQYPASLKGVGGAKTGVAPVNLLDIQTVDDNLFFWADRRINAPLAIAQQFIPTFVTPPVPIPAGQSLAWALPTAVALTQPHNGIATADLTSASLTASATSSLGSGGTAEAVWTGFQLPPVPPDAVIAAIYPVLYAGASCTGYPPAPLPVDQSFASWPSSAPFSDQQLNGAAFPSPTLADLAAAQLGAEVASSVATPGSTTLTVDFIGFAVYYASATGQSSFAYEPWLLRVPSFSFHRSLQTDIGSFVVQNLSGDTLSRDVEKILRASAMEGAFFVYRSWQPDAEAAWLEVHGTLTVGEVGVDTMTLKASQLLSPSQDDTPLEIYCETCQLQWAGLRCGSTETTECNYSFQTCQSTNRIMVALNDYEKNFGETTANTAMNVINRRRRI